MLKDADTVASLKPALPAESEQKPQKVIVTSGKTLRLIALEKFGNKEFWIYIYLKNKARVSNPNVVPEGTELLMPSVTEFDINSSDAKSVNKAKALGNAEIQKF